MACFDGWGEGKLVGVVVCDTFYSAPAKTKTLSEPGFFGFFGFTGLLKNNDIPGKMGI